MCRNIQLLHHLDPVVTEEECRAAALQYVRKVSGMRDPAKGNREAFDRAVDQITEITRRLVLEELSSRGTPKAREDLAAAARARGRQREERTLRKVIDGLAAARPVGDEG